MNIKVLFFAIMAVLLAACTDYSADIQDLHKDHVAVKKKEYKAVGDSVCGDLWCGPRRDYLWDVDNGPRATWTDSLIAKSRSDVELDNYSVIIHPDPEAPFDEEDLFGHTFAYQMDSMQNVLDWGGMCFVYESSVPLYVETLYRDSVSGHAEVAMGYLPSSDGEVATVGLKWKQFVSAGKSPWNNETAKLFFFEVPMYDADFREAYIDGKDADELYFRLLSVGRYGTCGKVN